MTVHVGGAVGSAHTGADASAPLPTPLGVSLPIWLMVGGAGIAIASRYVVEGSLQLPVGIGGAGVRALGAYLAVTKG